MSESEVGDFLCWYRCICCFWLLVVVELAVEVEEVVKAAMLEELVVEEEIDAVVGGFHCERAVAVVAVDGPLFISGAATPRW